MVQTAPQVFQTAKAVDGFLYEFFYAPLAVTSLTVVEIDLKSGAKLELLECTSHVRPQVVHLSGF